MNAHLPIVHFYDSFSYPPSAMVKVHVWKIVPKTIKQATILRVATLADALRPVYTMRNDDSLGSTDQLDARIDTSHNLAAVMYGVDPVDFIVVPSDLNPKNMKAVAACRTFVLSDDSNWPEFVPQEDNWNNVLRTGNAASLHIPLFPRIAATTARSSSSDLDTGASSSHPVLSFTQKDVNTYLEACTGSVSDKRSRRSSSSGGNNNNTNWLALFESLEQAIEGVASFELYPNTTAQGTESAWFFVSVHSPNDANSERAPVKFGWMFKQVYPSAGMWTQDFDVYRRYRQRARASSQYARSRLPIVVASEFAKHWHASSSSSSSSNKKVVARHNIKNPMLWLKDTREASLSTCPMQPYRLDADNLAWSKSPHVLGAGGFGKVIGTTYSRRPAQSGHHNHPGHLRVLEHADANPRLRGAASIPVAVAVKYIKGGYAAQPHQLLRTMMEKTWAILLGLLPPIASADERNPIEFTNAYIVKTFGYITHDNYIGLVMEHLASNLADQIDAYTATMKYVAQRDQMAVLEDLQQRQILGRGATLLADDGSSSSSSGSYNNNESNNTASTSTATSSFSNDEDYFSLDDRAVHPHIQARAPVWQKQQPYEAPPVVDIESLRREYERLLRKLPMSRRYSPTTMVRVMMHVANSLAFMHLYKLVHRDLKPANILIDDDGNGKLTDFTFVMAMGNIDMVGGTSGYIVPGRARQGIDIAINQAGAAVPPGAGHLQGSEGYYNYPTPADDVYAFGVCLKEVTLLRSPQDPIRQSLEQVVAQCKNMQTNMVLVYLQLKQIYETALANDL